MLPTLLFVVANALVPVHVRADLRYATTNNFTKHAVYPADAKCYLRASVAERIERVDRALKERGFGLLLLDCYRPVSAQRALWSVRPDPRYVADPAKGSRHNRGAAVDVTLVDAKGPVAMPTDWDDATERAHRDYTRLPSAILANRKVLDDAMAAEGFVGLPTEWWHFDAGDWEHDPPLDWELNELVLPEASQLVVVIADDWDAHAATLHRYEHREERWIERDAWAVVTGKGLGWGIGVHAPALARLGGPTKREGDKRSPAGVFELGDVTGYDASPPSGTTLPYRRATSSLYCDDGPRSRSYNRFTSTPSDEPMLRGDALYTRTVFVEHNRAQKAGAGSCIFLHVWSGPDRPTIGCTAMPLPRLESLIGWLHADALLVQLPRGVYEQLAPAWGL